MSLKTPLIVAVFVNPVGLFLSSLLRGAEVEKKQKVEKNGSIDV